MTASTYLLTGGARSGKSSYGLELAKRAESPFYIATGWAGDAEMEDRIRKHQAERGEHWSTIETRTDLGGAIATAQEQGADFIIVDCLTLWTSNLLFERGEDVQEDLDKLLEATASVRVPLVFVTNEVGSGIVPGDKLSRQFRDTAGLVNQRVAATVDNVFLCVSGIPVQIKGSEAS